MLSEDFANTCDDSHVRYRTPLCGVRLKACVDAARAKRISENCHHHNWILGRLGHFTMPVDGVAGYLCGTQAAFDCPHFAPTQPHRGADSFLRESGAARQSRLS
jgi:hypothetical protein